MKELDIDICLIQETKLRPSQKTPNIKKYAVDRSDRKESKGGGLITYIKESLIIDKVQKSSLAGTEST